MTPAATPPAEDPSAAQLTPAPLERELTEDPSADETPATAPDLRGAKRIRRAQAILGVSQTGKMGHPTRDALAAYQAAASLPVTGDLDADTWKALHR